MNKKELMVEYTKCLSDPTYIIENYYETFDKTEESFVPFKLFKKQKELVYNYESKRFNLVLKYRQAGITTVTAAYAAVKVVLAEASNPERILLLANKQETAIEFLNKIMDFVKQSPNFLLSNVGEVKPDGKIEFPKGAQKHVRFKNGSEIKAVATSKDALRGYAPTIMILDEAAFIEGGQELWSACLASISTGGKCYLISTPNGTDEIYYEAYDGSIRGVNKFHVTHIRWWEDPRYNKGFKMIKTDDILAYIQKQEHDKTEEILTNVITSKDRIVDDENRDKILRLISEGYKPHSIWYENMCRDMNLNRRMIQQELEAAFVGSGDNVIESAVLETQLQTNVIDPIIKDKKWDNALWVWKLPEINHRYIAAMDPSRGDAEDPSGFCIIDFDTFEQVVEYNGKLPPDIGAQLVDQYSRMYNALTTVDITGGMGIATLNKLKELNFPGKLLHYDDYDDMTIYYGANEGKIPGINFATKNRRIQIVQALEEAVSRDGFKIRSIRLINELKKFIYRNGKPDHMKSSHDDLIMGLGMCLFVASTSFKRLSENTSTAKAMLDSWKVNNNSTQTTATELLRNATKLISETSYSPNEINNNTLQNTRDFSWLFGSINKK